MGLFHKKEEVTTQTKLDEIEERIALLEAQIEGAIDRVDLAHKKLNDAIKQADITIREVGSVTASARAQARRMDGRR